MKAITEAIASHASNRKAITNIMKKYAIALAAAATAVSVALAGPAHADQQGFIDAMHALGFIFYGGDAATLEAGLSVCEALDAGQPRFFIVERIYNATPASVDARDAMNIVILAESELCS